MNRPRDYLAIDALRVPVGKWPRFMTLLAPPALLGTGAFDPWWEQLILGVIWVWVLNLNLGSAYYRGQTDAYIEQSEWRGRVQ